MNISINFKKIGAFLLAVFFVFFYSVASLFAFIERVSVDDLGNESNGASYSSSISTNGRYATFTSESTNLVAGDTNGVSDVFVYDRDTDTIERVSVDDLGNEGDGLSGFPLISSDGRYVAFSSYATNLVAGDTNGFEDIFVYDRDTDTIERVSVDDLGNESDDASFSPSISSDGRYVAFSSSATNLIAVDTNITEDIFVYDLQNNTIERVSVDDLGNEGNSGSASPSISSDGRYVAFSSYATNLVAGDTNGEQDVFVYDRDLNTVKRISVSDLGAEGDFESYGPSISSDGRYVAFISDATNLIVGDINGALDVFVYDRDTDTIERVSVDDLGNEGDGNSYSPSISSDGSYISFESGSTNLVAGDINGEQDIFVYWSNADPTDITLSSNTLDENQPAGTFIGTLTTTDPDVADTHTYSLACTVSGADDASYSISTDQLQSAESFNFESKSSYSICIKTDDGNGGTFDKNFTINIGDVNEGSTTTGSGPTNVYGCTDSDANNYNPNANRDDGSCLFTPGAIEGCTDSFAGNYSSIATVDDGSCLYGVFGCMDPSATNYNPLAVHSTSGSCTYGPPVNPPPPGGPNDVFGCMDSSAENFDPSATVDDNSCEFPNTDTPGCMDSAAINFNSDATEEDGSCDYPTPPPIDPPGGPTGPTNPTGPNNPTGGGGGDPSSNTVVGFVEDNIRIPLILSIAGLILSAIRPIFSPANVSAIISIPIRIWNLIPTLLGFKRRKRPWGTVYDSVTKQPLDPVYVMLKDSSGKEISTSITDIDGRYGFQAKFGQYTLFANKGNYTFPSTKLAGKTEDELYNNLYFGENLSVEKDYDIINKNIPMDAINFNWNEFEKSKNKKLMKFYSKWELFLARISKILFFAGLVSSVVLVFLEPKTFNFIILGLYMLIIILAVFGIKPRAFGFVTEKGTGYPFSFGILSVFSAELGREVAHTVIGKTGRYYILVPKGKYFIKLRKKTGEDSYEEVYQSESFNANKGYINKIIKI